MFKTFTMAIIAASAVSAKCGDPGNLARFRMQPEYAETGDMHQADVWVAAFRDICPGGLCDSGKEYKHTFETYGDECWTSPMTNVGFQKCNKEAIFTFKNLDANCDDTEVDRVVDTMYLVLSDKSKWEFRQNPDWSEGAQTCDHLNGCVDLFKGMDVGHITTGFIITIVDDDDDIKTSYEGRMRIHDPRLDTVDCGFLGDLAGIGGTIPSGGFPNPLAVVGIICGMF